jgi:hypothetical protein
MIGVGLALAQRAIEPSLALGDELWAILGVGLTVGWCAICWRRLTEGSSPSQ